MCWIVKFLTCWFMKKRKNNKRKPVYFHGKTPAFLFIFFRKYEVFCLHNIYHMIWIVEGVSLVCGHILVNNHHIA